MFKYDVVILKTGSLSPIAEQPDEDRVMDIGNTAQNIGGEDRICSSGDELADTHTQTDKQTHRRAHRNTPVTNYINATVRCCAATSPATAQTDYECC